MNRNLVILGTFLFLLSCGHSKQEVVKKQITDSIPDTNTTPGTLVNYLNVPGPIRYDKKLYYFNWSTKPFANYYRQEYLLNGEAPETFNQMIMIEVALRDLPAQDIADAKIKEIAARKATDPMEYYEVSENKETGEILLDFLLSDHYGQGNAVVEWDIYRYHDYVDMSGHKGIMVFALIRHGYGKNGEDFVADIKANKKKYIASFEALTLPEIRLAN